MPHVAARRLASFTQASDFLQRAAGEAGVERILLIGGDDSPVGPFRASLDLLATGVVERHGIGHVAFGGYPEGHPAIDAHALDAALQAKVALARQRGLGVSLVTQFGFEAEPILRWIAAQRALGIDCPVHVGIAGPATCGDAGEVRDPLRHRCIAARIGARPYGVRAHHGGDRAGSADRRTGRRGKRGYADRGPARVHLRRRAPHGGVDTFEWTRGCVTVLKWLFEATLTLLKVSSREKRELRAPGVPAFAGMTTFNTIALTTTRAIGCKRGPCHCEERSDAAISIAVRYSMGIASLRSQ